MNQYLLLLHETPADYAAVSPAEMAAIIERYAAWARALGERGQLAGGQKLTEGGGTHLRRRDGAIVASDGPYAESKDVIGGYFLVNAPDATSARPLAESCPHLGFGRNWIEIRQIDQRAA